MKRSLKVVNVILIVLFTSGAIYSHFTTGTTPSRLFGFALWLGMAILTLRSIDEPLSAQYRWALGLNYFCLICLGAVLLAATKKSSDRVIAFIGVAIICAPLIWNVIALPRIKRAARRAMEDEIPLIDDQKTVVLLNTQEPLEEPAPATGAAVLPSAEPKKTNYFVRHWRGELSLPVSYWINGSLIGAVMVVLGQILRTFDHWSLRTTASVWLAFLSVLLVLTVWSTVGIMRSAPRHVERGGSAVWASAAQVVTILGALAFVGKCGTQIFPQMKEYASLAFNSDSMERVHATITLNGKAIALQGVLGLGSYDYVKQILTAAPGVTSVVLDSRGGRLLEAEQLAALVRERKLNTYVENECLSACTYVFIAGVDRAATPNAKIGFHRPSFAGLTDADVSADSMIDFYRSSGISERFLSRVRNTPSNDMWVPTRQELIENKVINRITLGGENSYRFSQVRSRAELELAFKMHPYFQALAKRYPQQMAQAIDAAWEQVKLGATDGQISSAARKAYAGIYPILLRTADDEHLQSFLDLLLAQLAVAKDMEPQVCERYLKSELDLTLVFPAETVKQEIDWAESAMLAEPIQRAHIEQDQLATTLIPAMNTLPANYLDYINNPEKYSNQPGVACKAMYAFYQVINDLPDASRRIALRGLFQEES